MGKELVGQHSKKEDNEWETPPNIIESARLVMGSIDLDPASSDAAQQAVRAEKYHTINDSGLDHDWNGNIFLNPPYGSTILDFANKVVAEREAGNLTSAIIVTNNSTETRWWRAFASVSFGACHPKKRFHFLKGGVPQKSPNKAQTLFYVGDNFEAFKREFSQYGIFSRFE